MTFGEKIKNARRAKGLTQEKLGEILGVQKSAIAKYENGRVVNIKRETLLHIIDVLELNANDFLNGEEDDSDIVIKFAEDANAKTMMKEYYSLEISLQKLVRKLVTELSKNSR